MGFKPDYRNIINVANNKKPCRFPLYEHIISDQIMEEIIGNKFSKLYYGNRNDKIEYFNNYCNFFNIMGYDTVSYECLITSVMPGSGALYNNKEGVIRDREDFVNYPWEEIPSKFFKEYTDDYKILGKIIPEGMKVIGGAGNGVFECVQDVVGLTKLSYISIDDPGLYEDLFKTVGEMIYKIWDQLLEKFGDIFAVCRFGDDLGYKSSTLISPESIRTHIIPQYKNIVNLIHSYNKPFLLHSCGNIFSIMDDLINVVGIDGKHSNEDQIAPFSTWLDKYGAKIGNFGGIDTDILCQKDKKEIKEYVRRVFNYSQGCGGVAFGSGNSIPNYVPVSGYLTMIETIREMRRNND